MAQFSRRTILAAMDVLSQFAHTGIDRFLLEHSLERYGMGSSKDDRVNTLGRFLIQHPEALNQDGLNQTDTVVMELVQHAISRSGAGYSNHFSLKAFEERYQNLHRNLARDGFTVEDGILRKTLPESLDLPEADDEVHALLDRYKFLVCKGHLDQGMAAHVRGEWASANAQFRNFIEALFDSAAEHLANGNTLPEKGYQRKIWLAKRDPPFLYAELNEWVGDGKGFMEGFFRRLHPAGAHPGLSDEEDSTFRLHLVLLVGRNLLRRLTQIKPDDDIPF